MLEAVSYAFVAGRLWIAVAREIVAALKWRR